MYIYIYGELPPAGVHCCYHIYCTAAHAYQALYASSHAHAADGLSVPSRRGQHAEPGALSRAGRDVPARGCDGRGTGAALGGDCIHRPHRGERAAARPGRCAVSTRGTRSCRCAFDVYLYICIYIYTDIYIYVYIQIYICTYMYIYTDMYTYLYIYVYSYIHRHVREGHCTDLRDKRVNLCIYIYVFYIHKCKCTYIFTHSSYIYI